MSDLSQITDGRPLLVVGCGKMGGALLGGWLKDGLPAKLVHVVDPMGSEIVPEGPPGDQVPGDQVYPSLEAVPQTLSPRLLLLAVKPQMMADVLPGLQRIMAAETLLLSIAAGTRIERLSEAAGKAGSVIRAMPNTPSAIGKGVAVLVANPEAGDDERRLAESLLSVSGEVHWLTEEKLLDAVTGLSGSGPAYVFYLVEAMAAAGVAAGLEPELAMSLARRTVVGSGALLEASPESAERLRKNVTSPKGTTEAALNILMAEDGMVAMMRRAILAATRRGRELADS